MPDSAVAMRSIRRDGEVVERKLAPGTVPRIVGFAQPVPHRPDRLPRPRHPRRAARAWLSPLLFKKIIDAIPTTGGTQDDRRPVALVIAGLAVIAPG